MSLPSEKIYLNSIGMKLARIEPGTFMMGFDLLHVMLAELKKLGMI